MPKKRRQAKIPTPAWERPRGAIGSRILGRGGQFYGAVAVAMLIAVALGIIGYAFLTDYIEKQRRPGSTAVQVEDKNFRLDYFSNRLKMYVGQSGGQGTDSSQQISALTSVSAQIIGEEIVRRFADEVKVSVSDEELKTGLATRLGITADDKTFDVVFQQELTRSGLTEKDYRDMVRASLLAGKVNTELTAKIPKSAESVRYRQILVSTQDAAQQIRDQLAKGADFAALAKEKSLDTGTKDSGGDAGWTPRGALDPSFEELVFALKPKELTNIPITQGVFVIEMLEKDADRAIEDSQKANLGSRAFQDWIDGKKKSLKVVDNMTVNGDPDKIRWALERAYQS
ncbi:MAG: peptidylprolyl isomerase [Dehalococcoidia bacterium]|nr:peptidylprolyl isomerase [Dehalococcoidia bacterium]